MNSIHISRNNLYACGLLSALPQMISRNTCSAGRVSSLYLTFSDFNYPIPNYLVDFITENAKKLNALYIQAVEFNGGQFQNILEGKNLLQPILNNVLDSNGDYVFKHQVFNPSDDKVIFPVPKRDAGQISDFDGKILDILSEIQGSSIEKWIQEFENLLLSYGVFIPWLHAKVEDQPLYESARLIAAYMASAGTEQAGVFNMKPKFIFVGADLSGIQNYLFDIYSKNAAKSLKGRSFYLHLLIDAILRRVLKDTGFQQGHIIYATAGGFYLLLPDTNEIRGILDHLIDEIQINNFKKHKDKLIVAMGYVSVNSDDIQSGNSDLVFKALAEKVNLAKRQPYFQFSEQVFNHEIQEDIDDTEDLVSEDNISIISQNYKNSTLYDQQKQLGKVLNKAVGIAVYYNQMSDGVSPLDLGITYLPVEDLSLGKNADLFILLNMVSDRNTGLNVPIQTLWYGGNKYPAHKNGKPLTYNELSESEGINRLGVLRMDVDNLGSVFIQGLPSGRKSLARYAALSRSMDFFFKLHLNHLRQSIEHGYQNSIQIVYAGGDDLFLVGKWDACIRIADDIQRDFLKYTGNNSSLSVSGGISLVGGKFPIIRAAQWAGDQEDLAKEYRFDNRKKNAFGIFNYALQWNQEWKIVLEMKSSISNYIEMTGERSLLRRIYSYADIIQSESKNLKWKWQMAYDFSRSTNANGKPLLEEIKNSAYTNTWKGEPVQSPYSVLTLMSIAARLYELETRIHQ